MMQGTARGRVGDIVFSRVKGQQTSRVYNPQVTNPRSSGQMYQRTIFADAVKFFTRGNKELFKFAFEDKKESESDYNAFMRNNAKRGVCISKAAFDNYDYPALGNWMMTKGSLYPTDVIVGGTTGVSEQNLVVNLRVHHEGAVPTTIGQLASALVTSGHYAADDILTIVMIRSYFDDNLPQIAPETTGSSEWIINQAKLSLNDERALADLFNGYECRIIDDMLCLVTTSSPLGADYNSAAAIHSRNTPSGLKVSTQVLVNDERTGYAIDEARTDAYIQQVIASWKAAKSVVSPDAILQGSVAPAPVAGISDFFPGYPYSINAGEMTNGKVVNVCTYPTADTFDAALLSVTKSANLDSATISNQNGKLVVTIASHETATEEAANVVVSYNNVQIATISGHTKEAVVPIIAGVTLNGSPLDSNRDLGAATPNMTINTANAGEGYVIRILDSAYNEGQTAPEGIGYTVNIVNNIATRNQSQQDGTWFIHMCDADMKVLARWPFTYSCHDDQ